MTRREAYSALARELEIPVDECHIAMFDEELCEKAVEAAERIREVDRESEEVPA